MMRISRTTLDDLEAIRQLDRIYFRSGPLIGEDLEARSAVIMERLGISALTRRRHSTWMALYHFWLGHQDKRHA
jgi:hypothetical protein